MNALLHIIPSGEFVARPSTVGTTNEELEAMARGEVAPERVEQIRNNMQSATEMLGIAMPQGSC